MPPQLVFEGEGELRSAISERSLILVSSLLRAHQNTITESFCYQSPLRIVSAASRLLQRMTSASAPLLAIAVQSPPVTATTTTVLFTGQLRHARIPFHEWNASLCARVMGLQCPCPARGAGTSRPEREFPKAPVFRHLRLSEYMSGGIDLRHDRLLASRERFLDRANCELGVRSCDFGRPGVSHDGSAPACP